MASCLLFDILHPFSLGDKLHPITINGTFFFKVTHNPEISLLISVYVHIYFINTLLICEEFLSMLMCIKHCICIQY